MGEAANFSHFIKTRCKYANIIYRKKNQDKYLTDMLDSKNTYINNNL